MMVGNLLLLVVRAFKLSTLNCMYNVMYMQYHKINVTIPTVMASDVTVPDPTFSHMNESPWCNQWHVGYRHGI